MRVVFCGTAAGTASAKAGAYCAGPGNAFWATLHLIGLTPVRLAPAEFTRLPEFGIGLTDICKVLHGSDAEVGTVEFDSAGLQARVAGVEPAHLAFNGKNAARGALERGVDYGLQPERIGGAAVWVLPSTSGAARRFWDVEPWRELGRACGCGERVTGAERVLNAAYAAFNARDLGAAIELMHPEVDWPNAWEGGRVVGREAVLDYWRRQFEAISSRVEPEGFCEEADGSVTVDVRQVVHDAQSGELLSDSRVRHRYRLEDGLIVRMGVLEPRGEG